MQFHSCFTSQSQHTEYKENNTNDKVTKANAATPYTYTREASATSQVWLYLEIICVFACAKKIYDVILMTSHSKLCRSAIYKSL